MRPGDFSPGNKTAARPPHRAAASFNEAGGFLPRKRGLVRARRPRLELASMRPGDFSPGNKEDDEAMVKISGLQ